jgi:PadR family transcriptional regulator, regulatory protein PadR
VAPERDPTYRELKLFALMLEDPAKQWAGADLTRATGIPPGNIYVILSNGQEQGIFESEWEAIDPKVAGRPRRRFFKLTTDGIGVAQRALRGVTVKPRMLQPDWGRA